MKKGETFEGIVERLDFPNKGILTVDGDRIVVKNVLPGQKIRGIIGKKRKGKAEGRLLELLERSPMESETEFCPVISEAVADAAISPCHTKSSWN